MRHLAIDEIPSLVGQKPRLLNGRQQRAADELGAALADILRGGKLADHIARARSALDVLEREELTCMRCGVVLIGPHGPCRRAETVELTEWLRGAGRHWETSMREVQIGGKKPSVEHRVRLFENGKTVSVGAGPTESSAERDALMLLPKGKR